MKQPQPFNLRQHCCAIGFLAFLFLALGITRSAGSEILLPGQRLLLTTHLANANSDVSTPGRPAVGFDGTNYLVVTWRTVGEPSGLAGLSLDANGKVLHQSFIGGQFSQYPTPNLAFDGTNYLLTFSRNAQIYGLRLAPNGEPLDAEPFAIGTGELYVINNTAPVAAFDGQRFLVAWQKYENSFGGPGWDIYGAYITPEGQVGDEFFIYTAPQWQTSPSIIFDGANYLVVWEEEIGFDGSDIRGARVSPSGTVLDPTGIPISTAPEKQYSPHLAFDGTNSLVVWMDGRNHPTENYVADIYATRISTNGVLLDGSADEGGIQVNTYFTEYKSDPRVCFDGQNFFVTWWIAQFSGDAGIYAARVSPSGTLLGVPLLEDGPGILIARSDCSACQAVLPNPISNGETVFVPWILNAQTGGTFKSLYGNVIIPRSGIGEVLWQHADGRALGWYFNETNFVGSRIFTAAPPLWRIMAQPDMNGDGTNDLLWQHRDEGRLVVWHMSGANILGAASLGHPNVKWIVAGTGDFNNDSAVDIVFRNANGTSAVWFMNDTNFLGASLLAGGKAVGPAWTLRLVGDMNGDPKPDLLWQNVDGRLAVWTMNGTAFVQSIALPRIGTSWIVAGLADFNADNKKDLLLQNKDRRSAVRFMDGTTVLSTQLLRNGAALGTGWRIIGPR